MTNVTPAPFIVTATFSEDYSEAHLVGRPAFEELYNRVTSSVVWDDRLVVVNSQLDHVINDENGAYETPPDIPFQVVSVPLFDVLQCGE